MGEPGDRSESDTIVAVPRVRQVPFPAPSEPSHGGRSLAGDSAPNGVTTGQATSTSLTLATSVVMQSEEVARARAFFRLVAVMVLAAALFMPLVPGPAVFRALAMACCVVSAGLGLWAQRALRDERRYTPRFVGFFGVVYGVVAEIALFYFGPFTAAVMVLPIGVYFFALSESEAAARLTYAVGASVYFVLTLGVALGVLPDLGPMPIGHLPWAWKAFFVVMIQVVFATTYALARSSRRATEAALGRVERANRQLVQREALLAEARGELARALQPGEGRYSGELVLGYRLGEVVGRGGMGEVYRAQHEESGQLAAFKLLHPFVLSDPAMVKRFEREAEIAARVDSPHVARILESGLTPSGLPFVTMEFLEGHDLAWHLRKLGRLRPPAVAELVDHAAKALVAIREAGIVHRDMKPQNLILVESPQRVWKVLDFGVSRFEGQGGTLTQNQMVGTPAYMAPEQAKLGEVDHRADVYALAAIAYRTLTGKPAYSGDDAATVLFRVLHTQPASPSATVKLAEDVELVLAIGLAKDREERFQRAEELASALRSAVRGELDEGTRARGRALLERAPWANGVSAA